MIAAGIRDNHPLYGVISSGPIYLIQGIKNPAITVHRTGDEQGFVGGFK